MDSKSCIQRMCQRVVHDVLKYENFRRNAVKLGPGQLSQIGVTILTFKLISVDIFLSDHSKPTLLAAII